MKQLTLILAFFLISYNAISQTITGKIVDSDNNPIPYVTLQIGSNYGVITNEEGVFTLETDNFSESDMVSISCLGYKSEEFQLSSFNKEKYVLEDSISELSEVFITNKQLSIEEILTNVRANISKNYSNTGKQKVFMRYSNNLHPKDFNFEIAKSSNFKKSKIKEINKAIEDTKGDVIGNSSSHYIDVLFDLVRDSDSTKVNVVKATKLINKERDLSTEAVNGKIIKQAFRVLDSSSTYKFKTGLFTIKDSLKVDEFYNDNANPETGKIKDLKKGISSIIRNNTLVENSKLDFIFDEKGYDYIIEGISYINEDATYNISFKPNKRSAKYSGKMFINTSDFAVVKMEYQFAENRSGDKVNLKLLLGIKTEEKDYRSTVIFKKNENDAYDLHFISQENGNYIYLSRSFKFIRNNLPEQSDKQYLKFKFLLEQVSNFKNELFFIDNQPLSTISEFEENDEYPITYISKYDPSIWKNYNVLSPVEDIVEYNMN